MSFLKDNNVLNASLHNRQLFYLHIRLSRWFDVHEGSFRLEKMIGWFSNIRVLTLTSIFFIISFWHKIFPFFMNDSRMPSANFTIVFSPV